MRIVLGKTESGSPFDVPVDLVTQTCAIVGIRGSGKTNTAVVASEGLLKAGQQTVIIDPLDVWWGLRSSSDGKHDGFAVVVIGGEHADIPLEAGAARAVADFVTDHRANVVISTRHLSKTKQRTFVAEFAEHLYERKGKSQFKTPMQLVIDEADAFAPQRIEGDVARCFGAIDDLVRRGRSSGFGVTVITQRPAVLHKDILTQVEMLVIHRIISPQDRKAIEAWVEVHDIEGVADKVLGSLHTLKRGEAWIWSPAWLELLQRVQISKRTTFDSSYTPKVGEQAVGPKQIAAVDLEALRKSMGETIERAKSNDPAELKRKISELQKQVKTLESKPVEKAAAQIVEKPFLKAEQIARLEKTAEKLRYISVEADGSAKEIISALREFAAKMSSQPKSQDFHRPLSMPKDRRAVIARAVSAEDSNIAAGDGSRDATIGKGGLLRMMTALAQRPSGLSFRQMAVRAGMSSKSGTFRVYLGHMRAAGWVEGDRDALRITREGIAAIGNYEPLPMGRELLEYWLRELGESGASRMLRVLADAYPGVMTKEQLANGAECSASSGTFRVYLGKLRSLELIEGRGELRASPELFEE